MLKFDMHCHTRYGSIDAKVRISEYVKMLSVALMAALDTAFGGIRSSMEGSYDNTVFITGFFTNAVLAAFLCYVGMILGIDLYLVGILIFGMRIFQNLAAIRHLFLKK